MDLFTEIFPVNLKSLPRFTLYDIKTIGKANNNTIGGKIRYHLEGNLFGNWSWDRVNQCLITDSNPSETDLNKFVEKLWESKEEIFKTHLESILINDSLQPSPQGIANFIAQCLLKYTGSQIRNILAKFTRDKGKYNICLECSLYGLVVNGHPSVSVSLKSRLDYKGTVKDYLTTIANPEELIGLHVTDVTKPDFQSSMKIVSLLGKLGENNTRQRLLSYPPSPKMIEVINRANDDELVVQVKNKYSEYSYVISGLRVRVYNEDYERLNISEKLQITSDKRVEYIKLISKVLKDTGLINGAYASNRYQHIFQQKENIGYSSELLFGNGNKSSKNIFNSLKRFGVYKYSSNKVIRIGIVNTLPKVNLNLLKDNIRKELGKTGLKYDLKSAGEENISVLSKVNLETAINNLEAKHPDIILGIISGSFSANKEEWSLYDHFKNLTLKKNIPSQVLRPESMIKNW